jgi:hypothetical protein
MGDVLLLKFDSRDMKNLIDRLPKINGSLIRELNHKIGKLPGYLTTTSKGILPIRGKVLLRTVFFSISIIDT